MIKKYLGTKEGITLIELLVASAILSLVIAGIFPVYFFGNSTYSLGRTQYDIQSNIRLASDAIRDRVRYVTDLTVMSSFDPASADPNFSYIYLTSDNKSIRFKEGALSPVDIVNSSFSDVEFDLYFAKGSTTGAAIRFSSSVAAMGSVDKGLQYRIFGESTTQNKQYEVETDISLLNLNSSIPDAIYVQGPVANPAEGEVPAGTAVTLTANSGASIYYTTNGNTPNTSSPQYVNPISITANMALKAISVKDGISSTVAIYDYTISSPQPTASSVTITGTADVGRTLTVSYSYTSSAIPSLLQSSSIVKWYKATHQLGNPNHSKILIHTSSFVEGVASTRQYTTVSTDRNHYIYVEIIPIDSSGTLGGSAWTAVDFGKI